MKNLPKARVARLAECHNEQKAGYIQHASLPFRNTTTNPKIDNILIQMKLNNKSEYTINFTRKALNTISKHANLDEPEQVKMFIALLKNVTDGYKRNICIAYNKYVKHNQLQWEMPKYTHEARNIALPTREKLLILISNAGKLLSMKLQLSMETGLRPVELCRLKVKDIDLDHKTVNPTTALFFI